MGGCCLPHTLIVMALSKITGKSLHEGAHKGKGNGQK